MEPQTHDVIVDISETLARVFGTTGKMLLPCPATVASVLIKVPERKLITTDLIRRELANQFEVDETCPFDTKLCLRAIANNTDIAYWRALKGKGELMAYFPGGIAGHAAHLIEEGFTVETKGKIARVKHFSASLVRFG